MAFNITRDMSIKSLDDQEYRAANQAIWEKSKTLCNALAMVTTHTSDEWRNTLECAVADYTGHGDYV